MYVGGSGCIRREFCHFADVPSTPLLKHLLKGEAGCSIVRTPLPTSSPPTAACAQPRAKSVAGCCGRSSVGQTTVISWPSLRFAPCDIRAEGV